MIDGNKIVFGYGSIAVGANMLEQSIIFQHIEPPKKCGAIVVWDQTSTFGDTVEFTLNHSKYAEFMGKLAMIERREDTSFAFDGHIFDFAKFDPASITVCKIKAQNAMWFYLQAIAC